LELHANLSTLVVAAVAPEEDEAQVEAVAVAVEVADLAVGKDRGEAPTMHSVA
jgi:hypothetical protein